MMDKVKMELLEKAKQRHPGKLIAPSDRHVTLRQGFKIRKSGDGRCWLSLRYNVGGKEEIVSIEITQEQADNTKL